MMQKTRARRARPIRPNDFARKLREIGSEVRSFLFAGLAMTVALSVMLSDDRFRTGFKTAFGRIAEFGPVLFGLLIVVITMGATMLSYLSRPSRRSRNTDKASRQGLSKGPAIVPPMPPPPSSGGPDGSEPTGPTADAVLAVSRTTAEMKRRLSREIEALMRRGNLNLVLGTFTTAAGIVVIAIIAFGSAPLGPTGDHWTPTFLMRLSLAVFIEVFAFFFLRMYRTNLSEVKYYQNEITNLECRMGALLVSIITGSRAEMEKSLAALTRTERNFTLSKGETTVDLEKLRIESEGFKYVIAQLGESLSGLDPFSAGRRSRNGRAPGRDGEAGHAHDQKGWRPRTSGNGGA